MAMDLTGASITTAEVREITQNIKNIGNDLDDTMKSVNDIMTTLTGQSEGGLIENTTTAVQELNKLMDVLVCSILNIGLKIGEYLNVMLTQDQEGADILRKSIQSNAYGTR